ncbi:MAG TPA: hypothetical protein VMH61_05505 [Candidatus Acidoferrales bacterium]|nr:hypothetical protein [Candidatus Acidoferrales bacterium]
MKRVDLALLCAYGVTRVPFLYVDGAPDWDQQHIATGVLDAIRRHTWFAGTHLYGPTFSAGYHALLFAFAPVIRAHPFAIFPMTSVLGLFGRG